MLKYTMITVLGLVGGAPGGENRASPIAVAQLWIPSVLQPLVNKFPQGGAGVQCGLQCILGYAEQL